MANFGLKFFQLVWKFVISFKNIEFYETFDKITIEELKKNYQRAFIQLFLIFSHFSPKNNQSQSDFFFRTEEVAFCKQQFSKKKKKL